MHGKTIKLKLEQSQYALYVYAETFTKALCALAETLTNPKILLIRDAEGDHRRTYESGCEPECKPIMDLNGQMNNGLKLATIENGNNTSKRVWKTTKSRPCMSANVISPKFEQRKTRTEQIWKQKMEQTEQLKNQANQNTVDFFDNEKALIKRERREQYAKRQLARPAGAGRKLTNKKNVMSLNMRVFLYQRYHKCSHDLGYNMIRVGENLDYIFLCTHGTDEYSHIEKSKCERCGYLGKFGVYKTSCGCQYKLCKQCKVSMFEYNYADQHVKQYYDKHSMSRDTIVIQLTPHKEIYGIDIENSMQKMIVNNRRSKVDRENFLRSLAGKPQVSYAAVAKGVIDTIPEGGTISAAVAPIDTIRQTIKKKIEEVRKQISIAFSEAMRTVKNVKMFNDLISKLVNLMQAMKVMIKSILNYLEYINPITLIEMWIDGFSARALLNIASIAVDLTTAEKSSIIQFINVVSLVKDKDRKELVEFIRKKEFGILTLPMRTALEDLMTIFGQPDAIPNERFQEFLNPYNHTLFLKESVTLEVKNGQSIFVVTKKEDEFPVLHSWWNFFFGWTAVKKVETVVTTPESFSTIFSAFFSSFNPRFKEGMKILKGACEVLRPLLLTAKATGDVITMINKFKDYVMKRLYEECKDPRDYIIGKMHEEGNPLNDVLVNFVEYKTLASLGKETGKTRQNFYSSLERADAYIGNDRALGAWLDLSQKLRRSMDSSIPDPACREFEPFCLVLSGAAGTGKSTIWKGLVEQIFLENSTNIVEDLAKITCTWNQASEYQVGIVGKQIILFDDFGQNISQVDEQLALIGLCTTAPFPINSPTITGKEVKGMCISPELVVICTNVNVQRAGQLLASTEAIKRRYDLELTPTQRYDPNNPKANMFKVTSCALYSSIIGSTINFQQAKTLCTLIYKKKRDMFKQTNNMLNTLAETELLNSMTFVQDKQLPMPSAWQQDLNLTEDLKKYIPMSTVVESYTPEELIKIVKTYTINGIVVGLPMIFTYAFASVMHEVYFMLGRKLTNGMNQPMVIQLILSAMFSSISTAATTMLVAYGLYKAGGYFFSHEESGTTKTAKYRGRTAHLPPISTMEEGGRQDDISRIIENATGSIHNTATGAILNVLFIRGHYIMLPKHFFRNPATNEMIEDGEVLRLVKSNWNKVAKAFQFESSRIVEIKGNYPFIAGIPQEMFRTDVVLYRLDPTQFNAERDILKHFWNGKIDITGMEVDKYDYEFWLPSGEISERHSMQSGIVTEMNRVTHRFESKTLVYNLIAEATYASRPASCGSAIRLVSQESPILGIHVARRETYSYFHFVTRDVLEEATSRATIPENGKIILSYPDDLIKTILPQNSSLNFEGTIAKSLFQPTRTDLEPSSIYELVSFHTTEPAVLHPYDDRLPKKYRGDEFYKKLFEGYVYTDLRFLPQELDHAYESMQEHTESWIQYHPYLLSCRFDRRYRRDKKFDLSDIDLEEAAHEVLNGFRHLPNNTSVDINTSPGYPYNTMGMKRTDLISFSDKYYPSKELIKEFIRSIRSLQDGKVPFLPFSLTLKDERLKISKIDEPKTRIFACGSIVHYMIMRFYFYDYLYMSINPKINTWSRPTMDRLSTDWNDYAAYMLEVGDKGFDFDFKFWDRSIQKTLIYYGVKIMLCEKQLPEPELAALIELISSPTMIWKKYVFSASGIIMSGSLLTYSLNCVVNELMHRSAYFSLLAPIAPHLATSAEYSKLVRGMRGGDDTVTVVDDRILEYYNGQTVAEFLRNRGMTVTSPDKSIQVNKYSNFLELTFLKNKTYICKTTGLLLPLPEKESLLESMNWVRINKHNMDKFKATQENIICSLRGLFFHGKDFYNKIRNEILMEFPRFVLPSYRELMQIWHFNYHFPGAHADYALMEDEIDYYDIDSMRKYRAINNLNIMNAISGKTIKTIQESGAMDKQKIAEQMLELDPAIKEIRDYHPIQIENTNNNDPEKQEQTKVGATIQEAKQVNIIPIRTGSQTATSKNKRAEAYLNDENWDLNKLTNKFTLVGNVTWSATDAVQTILASYVIPKDIIVTPAQKAPFDLTRKWKCESITMKVVMKTSPFYGGCIGLGFAPFTSTPNMGEMINMGALIQKTSQNEGMEFTIPFRYPYGFLTIDEVSEKLGTFNIFVISPLKTGTENPQDVSLSVYVAITNSEFKIPDIIPQTDYYSKKFDAKKSILTIMENGIIDSETCVHEENILLNCVLVSEVVEHPKYGVIETAKATFLRPVRTLEESGKIETQRKAVLCDINDDPKNMPVTKLCIGDGNIAKVRIGHFQDGPTSLIELGKRWRIDSINTFKPEAYTRCVFHAGLGDIYKAAMAGLDQWYGLMRGSVNLRVSVMTDHIIKGLIYIGRFTTLEAGSPYITGVHHFDQNNIGQVMIPWIQRSFTAYTTCETIEGELAIYFDSFDITGEVSFMVEICLGDDFHLGVFQGATSELFLPHKIPFTYFTVPLPRTFYPISTTPEASFIEQIDRVLETTIPIVDKVSQLAELLDATPLTVQPEPIWVRKYPNSTACDNAQYVERLAVTNHNGLNLPDEECFGAPRAETRMYDLLQSCKSYLGAVTWSNSNVEGDLLWKTAVGPTPVSVTGDVLNTISSVFNYWNGGVKYIFDVIATEMHRGQLLIAYVPSDVDDIAYADATQTYFTTLDLSSGRGTICIEAPYLSERPYKSCVQPEEVESNLTNSGKLMLFVQNTLRSTPSVASSVDIVIYKVASTDYQLGVFGKPDYIFIS